MTDLSQAAPFMNITPETLEDQARLLAAMARSTAAAHEQVFELKHELASASEDFRSEAEAKMQSLREQLASQANQQLTVQAKLQELSAELVRAEQDNAYIRKELRSRDAQIKSLWGQIELRDRRLPSLENELKELKKKLAALEAANTEANERADRLEAFHRELLTSTSWRITSPLRSLGEVIRKE